MKKYILSFIILLLAGINAAWAQNVAKNTTMGVEYTSLQTAINDAISGHTIELLGDLTVDNTVAINKGITIDGGGNYTLTSSADIALMITGTGDVTLKDLNVTATEGIGVRVNNAYAKTFTIENSTITVATRGVDIYDVATGFAFNVTGSTIQSNVAGPTTTYTTGQNSRGISFSNEPVAYNAIVTNTTIQGFSYDINLWSGIENLNFTMTGGKTYGRAAINNHGKNNTFTLNGVEIHGLNNQTGPTEAFACIVDDTDSANNTYSVSNCTITSTISETASNASGSSASEYLVDLRGTGSVFNITNGTTYTTNNEERGGLIEHYERLATQTGNTIAFDTDTYAVFNAVYDFATVPGLNTTGNTLTYTPEVYYYWSDGQGGYEGTYCAFADVFNPNLCTLSDGEFIKLQRDVTLTDDVTLDKSFNLDFNNHAINLNGHTIKLEQGVTIKTNKQTSIFTAADDDYIITMEDSGDTDFPFAYSEKININTANFTVTVTPVTYDGLNHKIGGQNPVMVKIYDVSGQNELNPNNFEISMLPYNSYDSADFNNREEDVYKDAYTYINAITIKGKPESGYAGSITVDFVIYPRDINDVTVEGQCQPYTETGYTADDDATTGIKKLVTLNYNNIPLVVSDDYTIDVDATNTYKDAGTYPEAITLTAVEGGNFTGTRKVDFVIGGDKDIAASNITATVIYTGEEQLPNGSGTIPTIIVKDGSTNAVLVQGTDYTITTKSGTGYEYIDAKTYTDAITITGIGDYYNTKTVDYIITPKDIADCTINASTPFTGSVINPASVVTVKDGDTQLQANTDYTLTVSNGYTYLNPQAYANAITVTGMGNYTGSVTKDFEITSTSYNIADGKLLVTSNAIYTGETQVPSTTTITVKYDGVVLGTEHYDITFAPNVLDGTTEIGYKDAQTYSRAITITAKGTAYYGSITADYVIAPRNMNDVTASEVNKMAWTGDNLTPIINGDDATTNNINLAYDNYKLVANNTKVDYTYISDPTPIKDPGTYTITFEGRGNFTGTKQLTVHVLKSINNNDVILAENIYIVPNSNSPITPNNIVVKDGPNTLAQGPDYTIGIYTDEACTNTNEVASITTETLKNSSNEDVAGLIFYVKLTGNDGNSYNETKTIPIYTVREYLPGTLNSTESATPIDFHAAGLSSTANTVNVALGNSAGNNVIATTTTSLTVPATATVSLNNKDGNATAAKEITLNITDIEDNAFIGCTALCWIDGTALPASFTPSSLERSVSGTTFFGVPKQALVYLPGTTFTGENYVYNPGNGNYYCEKFKIYDDLSGSQTLFSEADGYMWAYENIHEFTAYTIENTRMLTAGKHYTTCLPYDVAIPAGMKAYTLDATSTQLFGFSEVTGTLSAFTPYVLIPSKSGQLLSTVTTTVPVFTEDATVTKLNGMEKGNFTLYGTMRYMDDTDATGNYIMQYKDGKSTWLSIDNNSIYDGPCILPMRAYIARSGSGARSYTATFTDIDGKQITSDMLLDADDSMYYDLQGRKLDTPQRKGLYIKSSVDGKNGRKVINRR